MYHCLNQQELNDFLDYILYGTSISDNFTRTLIINSEKWIDHLGAINYCFSTILEQNRNHKSISSNMIDKLYAEINERFFEIHELDQPLIDHMIRNLPSHSLSIEENLIDLQTDVCNYNYGKQIRY